MRTFAVKLCLIIAPVAGCASKTIDFDLFMNGQVGKKLSDTAFDWRIAATGTKELVARDRGRTFYRYAFQENKCSWIVEVDDLSGEVLAWRYPDSAAESSCHNL